jgi:hypothetical protein
MGFTCNIFNCLNEENKRFPNFVFLFLFFFMSNLLLSVYILQLKRRDFIYDAFN